MAKVWFLKVCKYRLFGVFSLIHILWNWWKYHRITIRVQISKYVEGKSTLLCHRPKWNGREDAFSMSLQTNYQSNAGSIKQQDTITILIARALHFPIAAVSGFLLTRLTMCIWESAYNACQNSCSFTSPALSGFYCTIIRLLKVSSKNIWCLESQYWRFFLWLDKRRSFCERSKPQLRK